MSGKHAKLKLPSECIGQAATSLWPRVREIVDGMNPVYIDAENVEHVDTTAIQVLMVLTREMQQQQREVSWSKLNPAIMAQISAGAFDRELGLISSE